MRRLRHTLPLLRAAVGLANQPVGAREERHEEQSADQDHDDVDRDLRVADTPDVHEAVRVLVREGASHERVRHPRDRDQQGAPQRRPREHARLGRGKPRLPGHDHRRAAIEVS